MLWIGIWLFVLAMLTVGYKYQKNTKSYYDAGEGLVTAMFLVGFCGAFFGFFGLLINATENDGLYDEKVIATSEVSDVTLVKDEYGEDILVSYVDDGIRKTVDLDYVTFVEGDESRVDTVDRFLKDGLLWTLFDGQGNRFVITLPEGELKF